MRVEMDKFDFSLKKQIEIHRITLYYKRQAEKCYEAKAYFPGCILIGAALEGLLLTTLNCYPFLITDSKKAPRKNGKIKKLEQWKLSELLSVAKELNWLPFALSPEEDWDTTKAEIGDYLEVIRQIRNLVHPIRYIEDMGRKRVTKKYLDACFNIVESAADHITKLTKLSLKEMRKLKK
jgi:hypothetical protein